jgi:mercuric ion transport protein
MSETIQSSHPSEVVRDAAAESGAARERTEKFLVAGGILAALGAASCCVVPFALFVLGISGAWIGNLTALQPYQPVFVAIAAGAIGYGFYLVYRRPKVVCEDGSYCASPRSARLTKAALWLATILVVIAIGFPKLAPVFL